jgi:ABC-2 type transport system ATP-binding protein
MSGEPVIETQGLRSSYGARTVLDGLALRLEVGATLGFLGRNGAGKTTTLRILVGLRRAEAGSARVFGRDAWDLDVPLKQRIGYLPEGPIGFPWLRVGELVRFTADCNPRWDDAYARDLARRLALPPEAKISRLSLGETRRLGLLLALAHRPDLLVLDEPAGGLDPAVRREFLDVVLDLIAREGKSVLFSSHILTDVERVASHIGILEGGRMATLGPIDALQDRVREVEIDGPVELAPDALPGALRLRRAGERSWVATLADGGEAGLAALRARLPGARVSARALSLEEIFLAYVGRSDA